MGYIVLGYAVAALAAAALKLNCPANKIRPFTPSCVFLFYHA